MSGTHTIEAYVPANRQTAKAVRVTVYAVDGEDIGQADTVWLPRSIATGLTVQRREHDEDGAVYYVARATVPAWWVRKLDNRPGWVRRGERHAPFATRPM